MIRTALCAAALFASSSAFAQAFSAKRIRMIRGIRAGRRDIKSDMEKWMRLVKELHLAVQQACD